MQLVINTPGTFLTQKDECFRLKQKEKVFDTSPLKVESIVISNQAMITTQAVGIFKANFILPDHLGVGKSVSRGFGSVRRVI